MTYYRYDTHVHTCEVSGCGKVEAAEMVRLYHRAGYQGIIITDHYYESFVERDCSWEEVVDLYLLGYRKALTEGRKLGMDILLGMELRFNGTLEDYLVYGFDEEFLYKHPYLNRLTLASFREQVKEQGILIYQAHPFRVHMTPAEPALLDGVEAFNGNPRHNSRNDQAYSYGKQHGLYLLAGSDAHQPQDVGNGGIGITERIGSSRGFATMMQSEIPFDLIHRG